MKNTINNKRNLLSALLLALACVVSAQTHYVGLAPKIGYAALLDNAFDPLDRFDVRTLGGVDAGISLFYELEKGAFHFQTGLDIDYINSTTRINNFTLNRPLDYPDYGLTYHYRFADWKEMRHSAFLSLPVLFGAQFNKLFFLAGPKVHFPLTTTAVSKGDITVTASGERLPAELTDIYTHHIVPGSYGPYKNKLSFKPTFSLAAEIGMDLDQWLAAPPPRRKRGMRAKKTFKQLLHYRVSLFAEYAFLSVNDFTKNYASASQLAVGMADSPKGYMPVFDNTLYGLERVNSVLATDGAAAAKVNPFTIGVKFAVLYEFEKPNPPKRATSKPQSKPQTKPKPKPQPKPKPAEPPVYIKFMAHNKETLHALTDVSFEVYDVAGETALFAKQLGATDSVASSKLNRGTYSAYVRKTGYLPYTGVFTVEDDTMHFFLQEIREKVITLLDVHFATNKTVVLPESAQTLEDLYDFLAENPTVRIRIIGHTDNIGTDEANQRLSEGRAKSVTNEMVKRGIDASRIEFEGKGESAPVDTNDTEEGRAKNRRVEFVILSK